MKYLLILGIIISLLSGIIIFLKLSKKDFLFKVVLSLVPLSLLSILSIFIFKVLLLSSDTWSQNRLAATFALVNGYKTINGLNIEPVLTWTYGPIAQIAFLPVTFFADPDVALFAAGTLNIIYFFIPLLLFCFAKPLLLKNNWLTGLGLIVFYLTAALIVIGSKALNYSAFRVGPDAPSLCFAGLSIFILYYKYLIKSDSEYFLFTSSLFAVIALWTKQNLIILPIVLIIYVLLVEGLNKSLKYVLSYCLSMALISVSLVLYFDWNYLYFVMFYFPSSYPSWNGENTSVLKSIFSPGKNLPLLKDTLAGLVSGIALFIPWITFFTIYDFWRNKNGAITLNKIKIFLSEKLFVLPFFVGIAMIPIAFMSKFKAGGDINSFSIVEYFLMLSVAIAFIDLMVSNDVTNSNRQDHLYDKSNQLFKIEKIFILIVLVIILARLNPIYYFQSISAKIAQNRKSHSELEMAFLSLKQYDTNKIFFPDFPLANLIANHQLYHSLKGLSDRKEGRIEIEDDHFKRFIPSDFQYIAFGRKRSIDASFFQQQRVKYYLQLLQKNNIELISELNYNEFSDWIIYRRK